MAYKRLKMYCLGWGVAILFVLPFEALGLEKKLKGEKANFCKKLSKILKGC